MISICSREKWTTVYIPRQRVYPFLPFFSRLSDLPSMVFFRIDDADHSMSSFDHRCVQLERDWTEGCISSLANSRAFDISEMNLLSIDLDKIHFYLACHHHHLLLHPRCLDWRS